MKRSALRQAEASEMYTRIYFWDPKVLARLEWDFAAEMQRVHESTQELVKWADKRWPGVQAED